MDYAAARMGHGQIPVRRPVRRALHIRHGLIGSTAPPRTKFRIVPVGRALGQRRANPQPGPVPLAVVGPASGTWRSGSAMPRRRPDGGRSSAPSKAETDLGVLIRRSLDAVGRTEGTTLTAFTDGCPGLRRILLDASVDGLPILD